MSTRSQIGLYAKQPTRVDLKKFTVLIYRHSDGYPEGMLPDIVPFLLWWKKSRGLNDVEYTAARLVQYLCNLYDKQSLEMKKDINNAIPNVPYKDPDTGILGYGICKDLHWDIEYFYVIYPNGIDVYDIAFNSKCADWKLLVSIDLDKDVNLDNILKSIQTDN